MALPLVPGDSTLGGSPSWGDDGTLVFLTARGVNLIPKDGGAPVLLRGTAGAQVPRLLPDGSGVVVSLPGLAGAWDVDRRSGTAVAAQSVRSEDVKVVVVVNWLDELRTRTAAPRPGR